MKVWASTGARELEVEVEGEVEVEPELVWKPATSAIKAVGHVTKSGPDHRPGEHRGRQHRKTYAFEASFFVAQEDQ